MASVAEIAQLLAEQLRLPIEEVRAYARTLTSLNMLPKSQGRAVSQVNAAQAFTLVLALMATDRPYHAARAVRKYATLTQNGHTCADQIENWSSDVIGYGARLLILAAKPDPEVWRPALTGSIRVRRDHPYVSFEIGRSGALFWEPGTLATPEQTEEHERTVRKLVIEAIMPLNVLCALGLFVAGSKMRPDDALRIAFSHEATE
jgi:hypothetical protein